MTPEFKSCSLLLLYWGMLFNFSLRLLSKSELALNFGFQDWISGLDAAAN